jgi:hypothetical protein
LPERLLLFGSADIGQSDFDRLAIMQNSQRIAIRYPDYFVCVGWNRQYQSESWQGITG